MWLNIYTSTIQHFQFLNDRIRIRSLKYKTTGHQYIGTSFQQTLTGFQIHATVYFYQRIQTFRSIISRNWRVFSTVCSIKV